MLLGGISNNPDKPSLVPSSLGIEDPTLTRVGHQHNQLQQQA